MSVCILPPGRAPMVGIYSMGDQRHLHRIASHSNQPQMKTNQHLPYLTKSTIPIIPLINYLISLFSIICNVNPIERTEWTQAMQGKRNHNSQWVEWVDSIANPNRNPMKLIFRIIKYPVEFVFQLGYTYYVTWSNINNSHWFMAALSNVQHF